jgi:hypothetical protein
LSAVGVDRPAHAPAFFIAAYAALSVRAVLAGLAATQLSLASTFAIFASAVAALALFVAVRAWRARPAPGATWRAR